MSVAAPPTPSRLYRLSVAQYDELARLGVLNKGDRVELLDGLLVAKMTKNERHLTTAWKLRRAFDRLVPDGWFAVDEWPVVLATSEPEPDLMILRGSIADFERRKPRPSDLALAVEVSGSTYAEDLDRRAYYAGAGIVAFWIVNVREGRIEVYDDPSGPGGTPTYLSRRDYGRGEEVPLVIEARQVGSLAVRDILPEFDPTALERPRDE